MTEFREHPSLASVWDGTRLVPISAAIAAEESVWFAVPPDPDLPDAPVLWEALNASRTSADTFVVCGCPVLFPGVAFGDTVRVIASGEGALVVTEIVARGGYDSARLWFEDGGVSWLEPTEQLAAEGCIVDIYTERLVGISWPSSTDLPKTLKRMEAEELLVYATE
ncbi:DUF4265 domain-containing protein [Agromyces aureus]|uniref:DUF4265 domain-containing protein n=1 Tax=Agromyces aureus TaxID=453304 RepID=UPI0009FF2A42|nr:DUF4265 domain-containing protein [Agromyces aureus]